jgi:hypothetical protein
MLAWIVCKGCYTEVQRGMKLKLKIPVIPWYRNHKIASRSTMSRNHLMISGQTIEKTGLFLMNQFL